MCLTFPELYINLDNLLKIHFYLGKGQALVNFQHGCGKSRA